MDFATDLPKSTASGYTGIMVIINRLTTMATYLPSRKHIDSPEVALMFFGQVFCNWGVPDIITNNRGQEFTRRFWDRVCFYISFNHRLSTSFRPQTDGQTERQKQMDGAVPLSLLQPWARKLGWIVTAGGICIKHLHPPFHTDLTLLGQLQLPSYNAIQASQGPQFQITGEGRLVDGRHARDSPNALGKHNWGPPAANNPP